MTRRLAPTVMYYLLSSALLLATTAQAAVLSLSAPRFTITASNGTELRSEPLSLTQKTPRPLSLGEKDVLKVTFQVVDKEGKGVQPHQTFLRFFDEVTGEEGIQPVRITPGGKAKFELDMVKPPLSLPATGEAPLKVTLLLGSTAHSPLKLELFDLVVPASQPVVQHPDEASFYPLPPIEHTFRPEQKLPPKPISAVFTGLTLAPWLVLLGLWGSIAPSVPRLFSPKIIPFTLSLGAFEVLLFWYWVDLKLGQVLLYGAILGVATLFTGNYALASIADRRV
ncbi:oligosaccharyl transferase delta subunit, partial [Mycena floridula]